MLGTSVGKGGGSRCGFAHHEFVRRAACHGSEKLFFAKRKLDTNIDPVPE
jgi:hypothetical protein